MDVDLDVGSADAAHRRVARKDGDSARPPFAFTEGSIQRSFEAQARANSHRLAIRTDQAQLTYSELNQLANRQAHALIALGLDMKRPVAILLDQGIPFISALLAVLKAGGFFVPLDAASPPARNAKLLLDTGACGLMTSAGHRSAARSIAPDNCAVLDVDTLSSDLPTDDPGIAVRPDDLACLLYTSGSTGEPKGVMHEHRGLVHNAARHRNLFNITHDDRLTLLYTCSVYGGLRDILNALLSGASLHTFSLRQRGVAGLGEWLSESGITIYGSVVTVFRQLVATLTGREQFPSLRMLQIGGEPAHPRDVELYRAHFPPTCALHAHLSMTETGIVRYRSIDQESRLDAEGISLAGAVQDVELRLLDEQGERAPPGGVGEIAFVSRYIARGYWGRPELTADRFGIDSRDPQKRIFRTGDLGMLTADGSLRVLGRRDFQVKLRGNRIELGDIEAALTGLQSVLHAAVVLRQDRHQEDYLAAYLVARGERPSIAALRSALARSLPDHMIPSVFMFLDALPQTPNGKIDRLALPAADIGRPDLAESYVAPATALETNLAAIWAELLGLHRVGVQDDFFELGGNSLLAVRMMAGIHAQHGRVLPLAVLLDAGTIRKLAEVIARGREDIEWSPLVPIQPYGRRAPLFCVHPVGGNVLGYQEFVRHLDPDQPVYGLQAYGVVHGQDPHTSIPEMARRYIEVLREVQPHGPYYLGGESFGGLVAYEMACQLRKAGEPVAFLFLGDVWSINVPQFRRWRYWLACVTYLLAISWRDSLRLMYRKLLSRRVPRSPTKRYTYADELHRRNLIAHRQASRDYRPLPYPGGLVLFRAAENDRQTRRLQHYFGGPHMCWRALAAAVEVHWMPDIHFEMMHGSNAFKFARTLQECVNRAQAAVGEPNFAHGAAGVA
jgi:amino acid adenylation domain-containing protein